MAIQLSDPKSLLMIFLGEGGRGLSRLFLSPLDSHNLAFRTLRGFFAYLPI